MGTAAGLVRAPTEAAGASVGDGPAIRRRRQVRRPVQAHRGTAHRLPLGRQATLRFTPGRSPACLLAPHLGLAGGQPGCLAGLGASATLVSEGTRAQVGDVDQEQGAGDREADPESGADEQHTDQLDGVEQDQRGEHPPPPVDGRGVLATARRGPAGAGSRAPADPTLPAGGRWNHTRLVRPAGPGSRFGDGDTETPAFT